ncbi:MAG: hypothetical protein LUH82_05775 [Clostridiales bacterium]|nr:hypothetical protein [Clostridiales bacterium]
MKMKKFAIPFCEDKRMLWAARRLENLGFEQMSDPEKADFIILPVLTKRRMFDAVSGKNVFYGVCSDAPCGKSYMENENYVYKNALLTAEGAAVLLGQVLPYSFFGAQVLIVGYGRIGKALHKIFAAFGSRVTVCSRSEESASAALFSGARHIGFDELKHSNDFDIIINTVEHIVLAKAELSAMKKDAVILDLASFPGGVDTLVADSLGLTLINGKGMPAKYTPETAGAIIADAVCGMIKEELT